MGKVHSRIRGQLYVIPISVTSMGYAKVFVSIRILPENVQILKLVESEI